MGILTASQKNAETSVRSLLNLAGVKAITIVPATQAHSLSVAHLFPELIPGDEAKKSAPSVTPPRQVRRVLIRIDLRHGPVLQLQPSEALAVRAVGKRLDHVAVFEHRDA